MRKGQPTARDRLREFLREHPNPCAAYTGREVGDAIGVSRERVRQLFGGKYNKQAEDRRKQDSLVALFVRYRPEAQVPKSLGGMSYRQIAEELGLAEHQVLCSWRRLGLVPHGELFHPTRLASDRAWRAKILRIERCIVCGRRFPWTQQRELNRRRHGCRIVCGISCGKKAGPKGVAT